MAISDEERLLRIRPTFKHAKIQDVIWLFKKIGLINENTPTASIHHPTLLVLYRIYEPIFEYLFNEDLFRMNDKISKISHPIDAEFIQDGFYRLYKILWE